jgi:hypothetical protein
VIEQQFAAIGVNITPAHVEIETPKLSMNITTESPRMTIDRKAPTFEMDFDPYNAGDVLEPDVLVGDNIAQNIFKDEYNKPDAGLTKRGVHRVAGAVKRANRAAQTPRRKLKQLAIRELKLKTAPPNRPKVKWDPGYLHIDWSGHRINIDWEGEYIPDITVDPPYSIEIYLRNKPYFRITVEEGEAPYEAGQRVDQAV